MKKTRFTAAFLAVLMLVMSLSTIAFAANKENNTATVTITNDSSVTSTSIAGVHFAFFKVFDLDIVDAADATDSTPAVSEKITYSVNEDFIGFFNQHVEPDYPEVGAEDYDAKVIAFNNSAMDYVHGFKVTDEETNTVTNTMQELVSALRTYITEEEVEPESATTAAQPTVGSMEAVKSEEIPYGYYLILDADNTAAQDGIVPAGSLVTVPGRSDADQTLSADVTIAMKGSRPKMDKEVWHNDLSNANGDKSPTYGNGGSWDEVSDYQIGDIVEYRITATVPSDLRGYSSATYDYIITDTLSEGLELVRRTDSQSKDITIQIFTKPDLDPTSAVAGEKHTVSYGTKAGDPTFTLDFDMYDIVNTPALDGIEKFYIYFQAELTEDAKIATDFQDNTAKLIYSNNPYDSNSKGEIVDTVYTYTFDIDITKTEGDGITPLAGAVFALYEVPAETASNQTPKQIYLTKDTSTGADTNTPEVYKPSEGTASDIAGIITTNESGKFDIVGLDDETTYMIKEISAPEGFNTIDPFTFIIHATYNPDDETQAPTISTKDGSTLKPTISGLIGTIINTSAQLLPGTGGVGTTVFTVVGGVLMLGAVALLVVARRRKSTQK